MYIRLHYSTKRCPSVLLKALQDRLFSDGVRLQPFGTFAWSHGMLWQESKYMQAEGTHDNTTDYCMFTMIKCMNRPLVFTT